MALYWQNGNLTTFDRVAAHYEYIKPLRGKHAKDDVRPLGDRARKWERIKKVNNNCYVLTDGYHTGDDVFGGWCYGGKAGGKPTEADIINLSPIVWRKHKDGTETIKVRNGTGQGAHNGRYSFLDRHLPQALKFIIRNGKQFLLLNENSYYLAKSNMIATWALPDDTPRNRWTKDFTSRDDGVALTFRIDNGVMSFVDGGKPLPVPPKVRVDKNAKAKMKDTIAEFRDWAFAMYPLLPVRDYEYTNRIRQEVRSFRSPEATNVFNGYGWGILDTFAGNKEFTRNIINDPNHDLRLHLMYAIMGETDYHLRHTFDSDADHVKAVRAQFNRKINKACGFTKMVRG